MRTFIHDIMKQLSDMMVLDRWTHKRAIPIKIEAKYSLFDDDLIFSFIFTHVLKL